MSWVYLYGSYATGRNDFLSDLDYLVVADGQTAAARLEKLARKDAIDRFGKAPSVSAYNWDRLSQMYRAGSLFAWHLFDESVLVHSDDGSDVLRRQSPATYTQEKRELELFSWLVNSIDTDLDYLRNNIALEAGYLFTAMRNIGIVLSTRAGRPYDYSATAVLHCRPSIPFTRDSYMSYRATKAQRQTGVPNQDIDMDAFSIDVASAKSWLAAIEEVTYVR